MKTCLNCGIEITDTPGRRPKAYCGPACRQKHWQAKNKAKPAPKTEKPKETPDPPKEAENTFMGEVIPEGLSAIQLAVWRNTVKLNAKRLTANRK